MPMHVIWEQRDIPEGSARMGHMLVACLVTPSETGSGRTSVPIGSVETRYLDTRITCTREFHQGLFWQRVDRHLDGLALEPSLRLELEGALAERIPRPGSQWALWGVTCIPRYD